MFDFYKEWNSAYQKAEEFSKQVKQVTDFWIDSIISSLKQLQK